MKCQAPLVNTAGPWHGLGMNKPTALVARKTELVRSFSGQALTQFKSVLPANVDPARFARICLNGVSRDRDLVLNCHPADLLSVCVDAAVLGVEPNTVRAECAIVQFKGRPKLMVMKNGLRKIATRSGAIKWADGFPVFSNERFTWDNLREKYVHKQITGTDDPGELHCAYAKVVLVDGSRLNYLSPGHYIKRIEDFALSKGGSVWKGQWRDAMWAKTPLKEFSRPA